MYTTGKGNISARNVPAGDPFIVSQRSTFEWMPDISGDRVVWWESGGRVMLRNLKTGTRRFVHLGARPRVDGELVAWDGGGHGGEFVISYVAGAKIYVRNVARGTGVDRHRPEGPDLPLPRRQRSARGVGVGAGRRVLLSHIHIYGARSVPCLGGGALAGGARRQQGTRKDCAFSSHSGMAMPCGHFSTHSPHAVQRSARSSSEKNTRYAICWRGRLSYMWASL